MSSPLISEPKVFRVDVRDVVIIPLENWVVNKAEQVKLNFDIQEFKSFETLATLSPWQWVGSCAQLLYFLVEDTTVDWPAKTVTVTCKKDWSSTNWLPAFLSATTEVVAQGTFDLHDVLKQVKLTKKGAQVFPVSLNLVHPTTSQVHCKLQLTLHVSVTL
jgi:hypothetical protein